MEKLRKLINEDRAELKNSRRVTIFNQHDSEPELITPEEWKKMYGSLKIS